MTPLRVLLDFLTYDGTPPTNNPVDETRSHRKVEELNVSQTSRSQLQVAPATVNQVVPLAAATCNYLAIFTDQQITISMNGAAAITLTPQLATKKCPIFYVRGTITSLTVSNAGTVLANVDVRSVAV